MCQVLAQGCVSSGWELWGQLGLGNLHQDLGRDAWSGRHWAKPFVVAAGALQEGLCRGDGGGEMWDEFEDPESICFIQLKLRRLKSRIFLHIVL